MVRKIVYKFTLPLLIILFASCSTSTTTKSASIDFTKIDSTFSGIDFVNTIIESDTLNYFLFPYIYMGAGVSIGDFNNDGLSDAFFTANMSSNKLYLNQGNMKFSDISKEAGITGKNRWNTGVTLIDINQDNFLDIYVCVSGIGNDNKNQLFVNNGDLTFTEAANQYGIDDPSNSIQSTFFDYDNDGDLDLFVANYPNIPLSQGNQYYHQKMMENEIENSGHLYRNNGNGTFEDVTVEAKLNRFGLTLGIVSSDFNDDGYVDLYLSNDFNVPDYFFINNGDGTFREAVDKATGHTSMFGMGIDASDINNDGLKDLIQAEMLPKDYKRARINMASMDPKSFQQGIDLGFHYQYMQNSLQLNMGVDENNNPVMSEISRYAGVHATDWSWSTLFVDMNNDGYEDLFVTNGMKRDVNDNDINQKTMATSFRQTYDLEISDYPSVPINNFAFLNTGDAKFKDVTSKSGFISPGFSHGVSYGDLDNDGDLDILVNNLDGLAGVYRNDVAGTHFLRFSFDGPINNSLGLGTHVTLYHEDALVQKKEFTLTRGYLSSVEPVLHFGIPKSLSNKSLNVRIQWPDGKLQELKNVALDQQIAIKYDPNQIKDKTKQPLAHKSNSIQIVPEFYHKEDLYDDYRAEPLLPYRYSRLGPGLAVSDINGDGLDDFFVGNASGSKGALYVQQQDQSFTEQSGPWQDDLNQEDLESIFFDFDADGDKDLYVASGGAVNTDSTDRLYINTSDGYIKSELKFNDISSKAIAVADFNRDGHPDLFVGNRNIPGKYPFSESSLLLENNGEKNEALAFTDVTDENAPDLSNLGMVTDALWHDFDGDGWEDLFVCGEWMPITYFKNEEGRLVKTDLEGFQNTHGWWYTMELLDVDNDGDKDLVVGNLGLNHKYKSDSTSRFEVHASDFDENGSIDIVLNYNKNGLQLPLRGRECSSQQIPIIAKRFKTYREFAAADLNEIYGKSPLNKAKKYAVDTFAHHWFENLNGTDFTPHTLPDLAQLSSVNTIEEVNFNNDNFPDIIIHGNRYDFEPETPRNDAGLGVVLLGSDSGFTSVPSKESKLFLRKNITDSETITIGTREMLIFSENNGKLSFYEW
jgi:hypothetical protein